MATLDLIKILNVKLESLYVQFEWHFLVDFSISQVALRLPWDCNFAQAHAACLRTLGLITLAWVMQTARVDPSS